MWFLSRDCNKPQRLHWNSFDSWAKKFLLWIEIQRMFHWIFYVNSRSLLIEMESRTKQIMTVDAAMRLSEKKTENCKYALCIIPPKTCYITLALNRFSLSIFTHGHCCIRDGLNFNVQHLLREPQSFKRNSNRWNRWSCNWLETVNFITNRDEWARFRSTTKWKLSEMADT